jgi:GWxTD domain-containing protein
LAEVPVVIGHLRPVILMPVGLLTGMPAGQVESILLHELAHIRRADYLINLMQTVVEGLLFYHPAVWWISSIMRTERENCCDDLVVQTSGNAREYATALAALAENRWAIREAALAATGGNLVKRIQRLLAQPEGPRTAIVPALSAGVLVVTCGMALAAWQSPKPQISPVAARFVQATPLLFAQAQTKPKAADTAYDRWLKEEVPYIITAEERAGFGQLRTDPERAKFVEQFWERRNPVPGTSTNQFRDEHYRRIKYANDRFPSKTTIGWKTDRGRIYIIYGPPDEIESHTTGVGEARGYPFEQWLYRHLKGIGERVVVEFEDKGKTGEFRMISDPAQKDAFARPLEAQPAEMLQKYKEAYRAFEKQSESLPEPKELLNAELMALQSQLELKRLETRLRQLQAESEPSQRELLESQAEVERSQIELRRMESLLRELAERHGNSVFLSGSGPQVAVVILADRRMLVTIPFEFQAKQYSVGVTAVSAEGKTVWQNSTTEENHCGNGCPSNETRTLSYPAIPPGSYTLTAVVRDTAGSAQKTYVVHFTVN